MTTHAPEDDKLHVFTFIALVSLILTLKLFPNNNKLHELTYIISIALSLPIRYINAIAYDPDSTDDTDDAKLLKCSYFDIFRAITNNFAEPIPKPQIT